jgi:hypothetical protein
LDEPGQIPTDDQLTFDDYDPEWAAKLERKYGIKNPYSPD